jgi:RNA-binding protein 5/10
MNLSASSKSKIKQSEKHSEPSGEVAEIVAPVVVLTSMKKVSQNIAKWGERKSEFEAEAGATENTSKDQLPPKEVSTGELCLLHLSRLTNSGVPVAANGNVICTLCRRQFPSPEVLQRHEKESKLHAENLAKLRAASQESDSVVYRDRASERRAIHGQSEIPEDILDSDRRDEMFNNGERRKRRAGSVADLMVENPVAMAASSAPPPVLSDDINNPGNQLLRRMGWNEGTGLGKDSSGRVESIAESVSASSRVKSTAGVGVAEPPQVHYSESTFKGSLNKRTIARYEQISSAPSNAGTSINKPSS